MKMKALMLIIPLTLWGSVAEAQVVSVQANLFPFFASAQYQGGVLSVSAATSLDVVNVNENSQSTGFTNITLDLTTTLDSTFIDPWDNKLNGRFRGGSVALKFEDSGGTSYELSGPIVSMRAEVDFNSPNLTQFSAQGLFKAVTADLPANPTGIWVQMSPLWSSMKGIIFNVAEDLGADFAWDRGWTGDAESQWQFTPDVPEPGSLALLAVGSLVLLRKRRR